MKIAVVGSNELVITNLQKYLPECTTEIIFGSSKEIDRVIRKYAENNNIALTEIVPDYKTFGRHAPLKRSHSIIKSADEVVVFWDGISSSMRFIIDNCERLKIPVTVHVLSAHNSDIRLVRRPCPYSK